VTTPSEPKYARNGDIHLAYLTIGEGPPDLVSLGPSMSHLEVSLEHPRGRRYAERMASFARLVMYDRRGSGLSDRTLGPVAVEEDVSDLLAILDAVGADRPFLFGAGQGGSVALLFAATHPERCAGVIAYSTPARYLRSEDYPYGWDRETLDWWLTQIENGDLMGSETIRRLAPSMADDEEFVSWMARLGRAAGSPRAARDNFETLALSDIRHALPAVSAPVLVLHRRDDLLFPVEQSRDLTARLSNAQFIELPGADWVPMAGEYEPLVAEIQTFVTGTRPQVEPDRLLATVLFTDVVKSTDTAVAVGDKRWRELLDRHDEISEREIVRHGGRLVESTGDGVFATFDGPARGIHAALAIRDAIARIGISIRAGLHTGEIEVRGDKASGLAVHIGQRVSAIAQGGEVLVSRTLPDLVVGSGIEFEERGEHELKGVPGRWQLYAVKS
jgi:class 3 adenylate cyclase